MSAVSHVRTDDEIIEFSKQVPGYYDEDELRRLLALTKELSDGACIAEIGVECGRSASIYFGESARRLETFIASAGDGELLGSWGEFDLNLIDDWSRGSEAKASFEKMASRFYGDLNLTFNGWWMPSSEAAEFAGLNAIDLLHIDADHGRAVWDDLRMWLPKVKVGGVVVCHDYARKGADGLGDVFPQVTCAVGWYLDQGRVPNNNHQYLVSFNMDRTYDPIGRWEKLGVVNTQFAARRIA